MTESSKTKIYGVTAQTVLVPALYAWEMYMNNNVRVPRPKKKTTISPNTKKKKPTSLYTPTPFSPHTIKAFLSDVRLLTDYLPPDRTLGAIKTSDLNNFFNWLEKGRGIPCSPKSLSRRITSIKSFFHWLETYGALTREGNPAKEVLQRSVISPLPQVLSDEEISAVLQAADHYRHLPKPDARPSLLVSLLLDTGIKKRECLGIHLNHISRTSPEGPYIFIHYASSANRYKERKINLSDEWLMVYDEYLQQYNPVDQLFPWSPRRLEYLLEDIGKEAGLEKHLSFDMCRWTSSLIDNSNNVEPDKIRQKLGISKIQWREIQDKLRQLA